MPHDKTKVLIIDDSAVIRAVISRTIAKEQDMEVIGTAVNGQIGVSKANELKPDIIILDIEMPIMDGITALPLILKDNPRARVVICSTLSNRGADISVRALSLGAIECILKPDAGSIVGAQEFKIKLIDLIRAVCVPSNVATVPKAKSIYRLRHSSNIFFPKVVAIGSSTGGPQALIHVLKNLGTINLPIVITQHMPPTFTKMLAQTIEKSCAIKCVEATEGEVLKAGKAYIAPGGYHMTFKKTADATIIKIDNGPAENFCKPSVDTMLRSLTSAYDGKILCVMLTGMGNDGEKSCADLVQKGGRIIAQDEKTSVVWGMPRAVAEAGLCSAILPLNEIAGRVRNELGLKGAS